MDKAALTVWIEDFIRQDSLNISIVRLRRALGAGAVLYLVGGAIRDISIRAIHGRQIQVKDIDHFRFPERQTGCRPDSKRIRLVECLSQLFGLLQGTLIQMVWFSDANRGFTGWMTGGGRFILILVCTTNKKV